MRDYREVQQAAQAREARSAYNARRAVQGFAVVDFDDEMTDADIISNRIANHPDVKIHTVYPNSDYFSGDRNIEFNGNAFKAAFKAGSAFYAQFDSAMAAPKPIGSIIDIAIKTAHIVAVRKFDAMTHRVVKAEFIRIHNGTNGAPQRSVIVNRVKSGRETGYIGSEFNSIPTGWGRVRHAAEVFGAEYNGAIISFVKPKARYTKAIKA